MTEYSKEFNDIKLTDYNTFNIKELAFAKPIKDTWGGNRISCGVVSSSGKKSGLFFRLPNNLFSFGTSKHPQYGTWSHSLSLLDKNEPTDDQRLFIKVLTKVAGALYDHADSAEIRKMTKKKGKGREDVVQGVVSYKSIDGEVDRNSIPCLYSKLIVNKKKGTHRDTFYDTKTGVLRQFEDLEGELHTVTQGVVKVGSLYISSKGDFTIQVQMWESDVEVREGGGRRLLDRPNRVLTQGSDDDEEDDDNEAEEDDEEDSLEPTLQDDDDEEEIEIDIEEDEPPVVKKDPTAKTTVRARGRRRKG